ncbi:M20/M25/M40 family metallo-hydrolase [Candidatus Woesearchaeota archaeon]|nr:M20/M25/M40 family metallo-hydrolase [Candidatus Woesearchaeota archaeon]
MLKKLLEVQGVSGNEEKVRSLILKEIKKHVKDVIVDKFGNIIAHKKGKGAKVMLAAHMDEVGLMIKSISANGNIYVSPIGGVEYVSLVGEKVSIKTKQGPKIHGIVTFAEISDGEEPEEKFSIEDLFVDTGLDKKELKKLGIGAGSFLELVQPVDCLGCRDVISGKALDDRIGCYALIELAKRLKKSSADIYYVFTTQEELGLYGSKTSIASIDPDWAIVIDVTNADDAIEHGHVVTKRLGGGPVILVKDAEMISNLCISDWLKKVAKKEKIRIQLDVSDFGTTDALSISFEKGGIPTAVVGVAIRNMHTTVGIASLKDILDCIKLLEALLKNPPKVCIH